MAHTSFTNHRLLSTDVRDIRVRPRCSDDRLTNSENGASFAPRSLGTIAFEFSTNVLSNRTETGGDAGTAATRAGRRQALPRAQASNGREQQRTSELRKRPSTCLSTAAWLCSRSRLETPSLSFLSKTPVNMRSFTTDSGSFRLSVVHFVSIPFLILSFLSLPTHLLLL